jgi:hypothetical protein
MARRKLARVTPFAAEESAAIKAALRGKPVPATPGYQTFIEQVQGQQRLPFVESIVSARCADK